MIMSNVGFWYPYFTIAFLPKTLVDYVVKLIYEFGLVKER